MSKITAKAVRICLGTLLIILGAAGLVLPILPGWPILFLAALVLSREVPIFKGLLVKIQTRFPFFRKIAHKVRKAVPGGSEIIPSLPARSS